MTEREDPTQKGIEKVENDVFQIPEKYLPGILQGMADFKNGDYITLEEFERKYVQY